MSDLSSLTNPTVKDTTTVLFSRAFIAKSVVSSNLLIQSEIETGESNYIMPTTIPSDGANTLVKNSGSPFLSWGTGGGGGSIEIAFSGRAKNQDYLTFTNQPIVIATDGAFLFNTPLTKNCAWVVPTGQLISLTNGYYFWSVSTSGANSGTSISPPAVSLNTRVYDADDNIVEDYTTVGSFPAPTILGGTPSYFNIAGSGVLRITDPTQYVSFQLTPVVSVDNTIINFYYINCTVFKITNE